MAAEPTPRTTPERFTVMVTNVSGRSEMVDDARRAGVTSLILSVPWAMVALHETQAQRNHGQTVLRLHERGGLSAAELVAVLEDHEVRRMPMKAVYDRLYELVSGAFMTDVTPKAD